LAELQNATPRVPAARHHHHHHHHHFGCAQPAPQGPYRQDEFRPSRDYSRLDPTARADALFDQIDTTRTGTITKAQFEAFFKARAAARQAEPTPPPATSAPTGDVTTVAPADAKPAEQRPAESLPADAQSADQPPADTRPGTPVAAAPAALSPEVEAAAEGLLAAYDHKFTTQDAPAGKQEQAVQADPPGKQEQVAQADPAAIKENVLAQLTALKQDPQFAKMSREQQQAIVQATQVVASLDPKDPDFLPKLQQLLGADPGAQ